MATPNYGYEKRQRELAKKRKKEEKALRKAQGLPPIPDGEDSPEGPSDTAEPAPGSGPDTAPTR